MTKLLCLLAFLFTSSASASESVSKLNPLTGRAFFKRDTIVAGELADLQIELHLQEGFFAYDDRFQLKVIKPNDVQVGELFISPIVEFDDSVSKKRKTGIQGDATIVTQLSLPDSVDSTDGLSMQLTYIACTKKFCLTPRILNLETQVQIKEPENKKPDVDSSAYIQKQISDNLGYALVLIFLFGLLTSLTPCVYPLIPITLAILGSNREYSKAKSFFISLSYVLGIGITYAILGVVAAQTGQLFGSLIGHPAVVITMSLIFFAMGLSLLGVFEIQAPSFLRDKASTSKFKPGFIGAFVSGLVAGIIASPCVGPVLVGVLAYIAKSQDSFLGFILLFVFAMGFGSLFILLGTFTHLAGRLPRSGAWMNAIKTLLAVCLFALSLYYIWPLAKPYLPQSNKYEQEQGVQWEKFSKEKIAEAKAKGQPVIIDFYADWCAACLELDELTFPKPEVVSRSANFMMLKVDATAPTDEVQSITKDYEVYGLPTILFIDKTGKVLEDQTLTGFEEAELFIKRMDRTSQ